MKKCFRLLAAGLIVGAVLVPTQARAQVSFGPQIVLFDFDDLGLGARVDFGLADAFGIEEGFFRGLFGSVNGSYVFTSGTGDFDVTTLVFNANPSVTFDTDRAAEPYVGLGINVIRTSLSFNGESVSDTSSGLNLLSGLFFGLGTIPAFAEVQYTTTGSGFITLSGGVLFGGR